MAGTEKYPTQASLVQQINDLTARIEKLERSNNPTQVVFHDSSGTVLMRAGTDPNTGQRGFQVGRNDGVNAISVNGTATQNVAIRDKSGQLVFGDSEVYDSGIQRPSISHNVVVTGTTLPANTNTIYNTVGECHFRKSNPAIEILLYYFSSDGATGIQLRFRDANTNAQFNTASGGVYNPTFNPAPAIATYLRTPPLELGEAFPVGGEIHLIIEAQRISGTGTYTVQSLAVRGADG